MATTSELRQRIRDNLFSSYPDERPYGFAATTAANAAVTTYVVPDGDSWAAGDVLENGETAEQMLVSSVSTDTLTVQRGYNGTDPLAVTIGDPIYKNPRITVQQIDQAIDAIMSEFEGHGIFAIAQSSFTLVAGQYIYSLTNTANPDVVEPGVLSVFYKQDNSDAPVAVPFKYYNTLTTDGTDIQYTVQHFVDVREWGEQSVGDKLHFICADRIDSAAQLTAHQAELVVLGATGRLIGKMLAPLTHDPGSRTNQRIQAGQPGRDARWYQAEYYMGMRREEARLYNQVKRLPTSMKIGRQQRWRF